MVKIRPTARSAAITQDRFLPRKERSSLAIGPVATRALVTELARGALQSIHHGQIDAAKAIGLTFGQRAVHVLLPQALNRFLPAWINSVTDAVKGSALVSLIGVVDLMLAIQQVIGRTYQTLPLYLLGAAIYFAINYSLSTLSRRLEQRTAYKAQH